MSQDDDRKDDDRKIAALDALIRGARSAVVFTGAGVSTGSGIPDFRSPGGLWSKNRPIDFDDFYSSLEMRREAWRRKFTMDDATRGAAPNAAHRAIARFVREGRASVVVTQNIDGLHEASGVPRDRLIELHGNGTYAACLDCRARHELTEVRAVFEASGDPPDCRVCGGLVKSATISFGQAMPVEAMMRAEAAAREADLFLVLGSSLVVYPAAALPVAAKRAGAALVIANREPTDLDPYADLLLRGDLVEIFGP
ncbi:SIR2 family NAD-dependent protein deacylase [Chenggangzhangella methanolivorans]|uniref:protein acetyllysine N-acetyltransferase n=2 Tax=Chenggangzhangella methanolivorans TaxID=1437009 RepID=A0A9E6R9P7_9HYPH|nr:Sir2 family NAD-dependent protein deacetylase [Chenggangzhangella methanolivorans]QZO00704.1 Sir2 family NAD-dependent protein deacetylase [Chenggangzhangella methanolivorans]